MPDAWNFTRRQPKNGDWFMQAPLLTSLLCAACVFITLASWAAQWSHGTVLPQFADFGVEDQEQIWSGHPWSLLTTIFLHANPLHLIFNMLWLYQLGSLLERTLNTLAYALFLAAAAVVSSCCELLFGSTGIGASGVVYALFGLMWAGRGRYPEWGGYANPSNLRLFIGWGLFCFVATLLNVMHIGNAAHAGGFLFGLSVGWLCLSARPHRWLWSLPLVGLIALAVLSVTWMPWSDSWDFWKGNHEFEGRHYARAITWYQRSLRRGGPPDALWNNIALAWNALSVDAAQRHDFAEAAHDAQQGDQAAHRAGPDSQDSSP